MRIVPCGRFHKTFKTISTPRWVIYVSSAQNLSPPTSLTSPRLTFLHRRRKRNPAALRSSRWREKIIDIGLKCTQDNIIAFFVRWSSRKGTHTKSLLIRWVVVKFAAVWSSQWVVKDSNITLQDFLDSEDYVIYTSCVHTCDIWNHTQFEIRNQSSVTISLHLCDLYFRFDCAFEENIL